MPTYKISGTINQSARIRIFEGEAYRGYKDVSPGSYEVVFNSTTGADVTAKAEASDGETIGFGNITAISGSFSPDVSLYPVEFFGSSGYWNKPDGVEKILVILGGGGGGGSGPYDATYGGVGGRGGGMQMREIDVTTVTGVPVTIGAGGAGSSQPNYWTGGWGGDNGNSSTFGAYITAQGGPGGVLGSSVAPGGAPVINANGQDSIFAEAGSGAYGVATGGPGAGGYEDGGDGAPGAGQSGVNGGRSAGGGGAGSASGSGGDGGDGFCLVIPIVQGTAMIPIP